MHDWQFPAILYEIPQSICFFFPIDTFFTSAILFREHLNATHNKRIIQCYSCLKYEAITVRQKMIKEPKPITAL